MIFQYKDKIFKEVQTGHRLLEFLRMTTLFGTRRPVLSNTIPILFLQHRL